MSAWASAAPLVPLGLAVGAFGTIVGAGGGFVLTPVLLLLYPHDSPGTITAISLFVVFCNAGSGTAAYLRQRRVDLATGWRYALATLPGAVGGALLVGDVPKHVFDVLMAVVLGSLAVWLLRGAGQSGERLPGGRLSERRVVDAEGEVHEYRTPVRRGMVLSLGVGFLSSLLGIGGGVVHVPLLVRVLGFPTHIATATSHFVLAVMSAGGTATHAVHGTFGHGAGIHRAVMLAAGVIPGAQLGAWLSRRMGGGAIERLLAVGLLALAVRLATTAL